jgi:membrane protein
MDTKLRRYGLLLKEAAAEFSADNVIKLSASLAYYTIFSIGPLLLVVISLASLVFQRETITANVHLQMTDFIGAQGADQLLDLIAQLQQQRQAARFSIIGLVLLFFGATGIFAELQDSINYIWSVRAKPKKSWLQFLKNRLRSFFLIVVTGLLLIASLIMNALADVLTERLHQIFVDEVVALFKLVNVLVLFLITTLLFAIIYKVLPDARIRRRDALVGAAFTALLFLLGRLLIGIYLSTSDVASAFGAAASVIIILSWVYYSSIILYFGAEVTKVYALRMGGGIRPDKTAVFIVKTEAKELHHEV